MKNAKPLLVQKIIEIFIDALLIVAAFCAAYFFRIGQFYSTDFPFLPYITLAIIITPTFLFFLAWSGLYQLREISKKELFRIISFSSLAGSMLFVLVFFFQREFFFSRMIVLFLFFFSTFFLFVFHIFSQYLEKRRYKKGKNILRTLIIGNGKAATEMIFRMQKDGNRLQPVAILSPYGGGKKSILNIPVVGKLNALEKTVKEKNIGAIVQTEGGEQVLNLFLFAEGNFLEFYLSPSIFGAFRNTMEAKNIADIPVLGYSASPLFGWGQVAKRATDIILGGIIFVICIPFFAFKTITKKTMATGTRDRIFQKYEFVYGKHFVKYLPEVIHVLSGEMSLVGPRPRSPKERDELQLHERRRLLVKPGIFGLAQLKKYSKNTNISSQKITKDEEIELDTEYIFHWNYWGDIAILGKSIVSIFKR